MNKSKKLKDLKVKKNVDKMKRNTRKLKIVPRLNERIMTVLEELSTMLQSKGEIFRGRAYKKALETIMCVDKDILDVTKIIRLT